MEDREIVALFWARNEDALEVCQRQYGKYLAAVARNILSDAGEIEEVCNDVLLKAWETVPPHRPKSLKGYLAMLCGQIAIDRIRERDAKKRGGGEYAAVLDELSDCLPDPGSADFADRLALRDLLNRFLASLPRRTRMIFVQRYWYLRPVAQIAHEFHMKQSAVTVLMFRAREKLKKMLEKEDFDL